MTKFTFYRYYLEGKKIRRVLHKVENFNTETYNLIVKLYGLQYVNSQDDDILKLLFENKIRIYTGEINFTLKEKHNSFEGNLVLEVFAMFSSVEIRITAYAENEEELLKEMKKSYEFLCDRFEQKYIKV